MSAILLFNADPVYQSWFQRNLPGHYRVFAAPDAQQSLALLRDTAIRLVFVFDYLALPDVIAVLRSVRESLLLVAVCAEMQPNSVLEAFRAGADDCLVLPLHGADLRQCLTRLENRQIRQFLKRGNWVKASRLLFNALLATVAVTRPGVAPPGDTLPVPAAVLAQDMRPPEPEPGQKAGLEIRLYLLGEFRLEISGTGIEHRLSRKAKSVFCYLLFHQPRKMARDVLAETFWPHATPESARNCLHVALHGIRQVLKDCVPDVEFIRFEKDCYFLSPELHIWADADAFRQHWRTGKQLELTAGMAHAAPVYEQAVQLYRGDFVEENLFETWLNREREALREIYAVMLDRLSQHQAQVANHEAARQLCERILEIDPCREDIHRRLMECHHALGQRDRAVRQFRRCRENLRAELEVAPSQATLDLYERIRNG